MAIAPVITHHCHFPHITTMKHWPTPTLATAVRATTNLIQIPPISANVKQLEKEEGVDKVRVLKQKMELLGIKCDDSCLPGFYAHLLCPKCKGGKCMETSLSLHIIQDADFAMWRCYHASCGWAGQAFADSQLTVEGINKIFKLKFFKEMTVEGSALQPLGEKLLAYFRERMISEETLRRNAVMQISNDQAVIAFTYRQNGVPVGCKYRTMEKKFWQEKGTEKWLYGLDDIVETSEIIIVEGEIDKLSLEEAGYHNCVSVPGGAPKVVSTKDMPSSEKLGQSISVSLELQRVPG